jgi:hypothetical protein
MRVATEVVPVLDQQMNMICEQDPRKIAGFSFCNDRRKAIEKSFPINVIRKDNASFDTPDKKVMEGTSGIESRLTWHIRIVAERAEAINVIKLRSLYIPHDLGTCPREERKRRELLSGLSEEKPPVRL